LQANQLSTRWPMRIPSATKFFIRTETSINNPKSLGLQKPALYLQAYLKKPRNANSSHVF
jgi:hypothetical protein